MRQGLLGGVQRDTAATPDKPQDSEEICCNTCSATGGPRRVQLWRRGVKLLGRRVCRTNFCTNDFFVLRNFSRKMLRSLPIFLSLYLVGQKILQNSRQTSRQISQKFLKNHRRASAGAREKKLARGEIAILGRGDHTRNTFGTSLTQPTANKLLHSKQHNECNSSSTIASYCVA